MSATLENAAPAVRATYVPPGETDQRTLQLSKLPVVIGRSDTTDLHLPSNRVSREHAMVVWEDEQFWVRDLGSTNGTFINGEQVESKVLNPGDTLRIADIEIALQWDGLDYTGQGDVVSTIRSWQEMLLHRGSSCGFLPVWRLSESRVGGCLAVGLDSHTCETSRWPASGLKGARVSNRLNGLMLLRAVELAAELPDEMPLLLGLDDETEADRWLALIGARLGSSAQREIYVRLPNNAIHRDQLSTMVHSYGMKVAKRLAPGESCEGEVDQYWLAKELIDGLANDETRWQPLSDLIRTANDAGAEVLATNLEDENTAHVCAELGCTWGTGPLFGGPRAACELGG